MGVGELVHIMDAPLAPSSFKLDGLACGCRIPGVAGGRRGFARLCQPRCFVRVVCAYAGVDGSPGLEELVGQAVERIGSGATRDVLRGVGILPGSWLLLVMRPKSRRFRDSPSRNFVS